MMNILTYLKNKIRGHNTNLMKCVMRKKIFFSTFLLFFIFFAFVSHINAAVPRLINYQGKLTDTNGVPLTGSYAITFRIYDALTAGSLLWEETQQVLIDKGIFGVLLGSVVNLNLAFDKPYYLEIKVGSEVMSPRQQIASVGYAIRAEKADSAEEAKTKASNADTTPGYLDTKVKNSITVDTNQLQLVGDNVSPGISKVYGTDASGNKGWQPAPLSIPSNIQVYSTPGTYTWVKPPNVTKVYVKVWGGGGGGGGDNTDGSTGGTSSFAGDSIIQATGGNGGVKRILSQAGGLSGTGSGGSINLSGSAGKSAANGGAGGQGGFGGGGGISGAGSAAGNGSDGDNYGGGGGGSSANGGGGGGGGGGYSEGLISVSGNVTVTCGNGGGGGNNGAGGGGGGGNGAAGSAIVYY